MLSLSSNVKERAWPRVKRPARLSEALNRSLNGYSLAAAAAGVSILASAMPAEGAPVCGNISTLLEHTNTLPFNPAGQPASPFNFAQTTFQYFLSTTGVSSLRWWNRGFFNPNSGGAKVLLGAKNLPADVALGSLIGPGGQFGKPASYGMLFTYGKGNFSHVQGGGTKLKHRGNLSLVQDSYVGFQFSQSGNVHYGWARLSVTFHGGGVKQTILHALDYGYESTPNTAIAAGSCAAGEPANPASSESRGTSLGMLALGSEEIAGWRKPI